VRVSVSHRGPPEPAPCGNCWTPGLWSPPAENPCVLSAPCTSPICRAGILPPLGRQCPPRATNCAIECRFIARFTLAQGDAIIRPICSERTFSVEKLMSDLIVQVTDGSFEAEVLKADGPVLVDYWAEWCGPCKMIAPVLDDIARDYEGKLKICKLNIDE